MLRRLLAALLLGALALLAVPAAGAATGEERDAPDEVFAGQVVKVDRDAGPSNRPNRLVYTVRVLEVYGDSFIDTTRVAVVTSADVGQCRQLPTSAGDELYFFTLTRQSDQLLLDRCGAVFPARAVTRDAVIEQYGEPREPGAPSELPAVTYSCPDGGGEIGALSEAEESCDVLADDTQLQRAAAPGLALVIVGLLGLLVARRVGRR